jgi:hypothetical protein
MFLRISCVKRVRVVADANLGNPRVAAGRVATERNAAERHFIHVDPRPLQNLNRTLSGIPGLGAGAGLTDGRPPTK